jgi:hypothetical protein
MWFALSLAYKRKTNSPAAGDKRKGHNTRQSNAWLPALVLQILPQYLQPLHQGLGGHASSPALLVEAPLQAPLVLSNIVPRAHRCWTYGPSAGTRINFVSLIAWHRPLRDRPWRLSLVSVGTTFRTDSTKINFGCNCVVVLQLHLR